MALRYGNWKVHFAVQRAEGVDAWQEPLAPLKFPMLVNLRTDPFEEADSFGGSLLLEVAGRPRLHAGSGGRPGRPVHADHGGVPAASESGELEPGANDGEAQSASGSTRIRIRCRSEVCLYRKVR